MEEKLISVIVPVYNALPELRNCIDSLCKQEYGNLEIVLVDDGSTDGSGEVCDAFCASDKRVKVIHQPNQGVSAARNNGLSSIHGDVLIFCDADDVVPRDAYKSLLNELLRTDSDVAIGCWEEQRGKESKRIIPAKVGVYSATEALSGILADNRCFGGGFPWNKLWKVSSIHEMPLFDPNLYVFEDKLWTVQAMRQVDSVVVCDTTCYNYLVKDNSLSHCENTLKRQKRNVDLIKAAYQIYLECKDDEHLGRIAFYYYGSELVNKSFTMMKTHFFDSELKTMICRDSKKFNKAFAQKPKMWIKRFICRSFWKGRNR